MAKKKEWEVTEILEDAVHLRIDDMNYFIDKEEACIAHSLLLLYEELKKIKEALQGISDELDDAS